MAVGGFAGDGSINVRNIQELAEEIKTNDFTAAAGFRYFPQKSGGGLITATLPTPAGGGEVIEFVCDDVTRIALQNPASVDVKILNIALGTTGGDTVTAKYEGQFIRVESVSATVWQITACTGIFTESVGSTDFTMGGTPAGTVTDDPVYGTGFDGDRTLTGNETVSDNEVEYENLTLDGNTLTVTATGGYCIIRVKDTLDFGSSGVISFDGGGNSGATGGTGPDGAGDGGDGGDSGGALFVFAKTITGSGTVSSKGLAGANGVNGIVATSGASAAGTDGTDANTEVFGISSADNGVSTGGTGGATTGSASAGGTKSGEYATYFDKIYSSFTNIGLHLSLLNFGTTFLEVISSPGAGGGGGATTDGVDTVSPGGGGAGGVSLVSNESSAASGGASGTTSGATAKAPGGGGGGGAGGTVFVITDTIGASITLDVDGGDGGDGGVGNATGGAGGGGGGSGGYIFVATDTGNETITHNFAGGSGGAGGASNADGNAGSAGSSGASGGLTQISRF